MVYTNLLMFSIYLYLMIKFILNNKLVSSEKPGGISLLDFIRYDMDLPGTKVGCREGDCGACTVLEGSLENGKTFYKSINSCLTPLVNAHGKHIVTIEGINTKNLTPVQKAIHDNSATQCGFCTPGFVMSLTAYMFSNELSDRKKAIASLSGNICRCTGYKSIEKAANEISGLLTEKDTSDPVSWLVSKNYIPKYFSHISEKLKSINNETEFPGKNAVFIAGGTDLMVQKAEELAEINATSFIGRKDLKGISVKNGKCITGAASTMSEIEQSSVFKEIIPEIGSYFRLISSEPIRNMATLAGNIVNASPIGDLTIIFLALDSEIILESSKGVKSVSLKDFFLGYKKLKIKKGEVVKSINFTIPSKPLLFNFEKVSKRKHLDIASVNTAIRLKMKDNMIDECSLSAGGVSPIPLSLAETSDFLIGKSITSETLIEANEIMQNEISPISDVRGSLEYKRLLLRQLFFAHFIKLFPRKVNVSEVLNIR
jgi:xanthine dehydrogenase small subunit